MSDVGGNSKEEVRDRWHSEQKRRGCRCMWCVPVRVWASQSIKLLQTDNSVYVRVSVSQCVCLPVCVRLCLSTALRWLSDSCGTGRVSIRVCDCRCSTRE